MGTKTIVCQVVSLLKTSVFLVLVIMPFNANASYYIAYGGEQGFTTSCDACAVHRRHVVHRHHRVHRPYHHHYVAYKKRSSYSITVYYAQPAYAWAPPHSSCGCCDDYASHSDYSNPSYSGVYYAKPSDRLVGNSGDQSSYYGPATDTGTADGDFQ